MKKWSLIISFFFALSGIVTLHSCKGDDCSGVVCANGGTCLSGNCLCQNGYEGSRCETKMRDKFLGTYAVTEDGSGSLPTTYSANIHTFGSVDSMKIKNFYNYFIDEVVAIAHNDSIIIFPQYLSEGYQVFGYGIYVPEKYYGDHGNLKMNYTLIAPNGNINTFGLSGGSSSEWSK